MSKLCGKSEEDIIRELKGRIYRNPASGQWEVADRYLTGNVKRKLAVAKEVAAYDPAYAENVAALEAVQPADIEPVDIAVQLGSTWVPPETVKQFVHHLLGENVPANILYVPEIGKWSAQIDWRAVDRTLSTVTWGIPQYHASELIEAILTNKTIQVKKKVEGPDGEEVSVVDPEQTAAANQKADEIRQAFLDWIWQDKDRRESLARLYNDTFNVNVAPTYDGSHLELPGAALGIELRPHQKNAVWRGIQEGTALFDHVVGAGKTMVCCATIMESKRMNLMSKPMVVVPNHLLKQWKSDFYALYPNADSLVRDLDDIAGEAANAAEMKAASSGNPLMLMQVTLDAELKKLEAIWKNHQRQQQSLERNIERLASADERADKAVQKWRSEIALRDSNTTEKFQFEHDGKVYGEKEREALFNKIQLRLQEVVTAQIRGKRIVADIGRYRGFDIRVQSGLDRLVFSVQGAAEGYNPSNLSYEKQDQFTMTGFISRLNNYLKSFEERCEEAEATRVKERAEYASAVAAFGKPFPQQALLEALRDDNRQVIAELKKLEANSDYVSDWVPKSEAIKQAANAIKQAAAQPKQEEPPPQPKPEEVQEAPQQQRRVASFSMSM